MGTATKLAGRVVATVTIVAATLAAAATWASAPTHVPGGTARDIGADGHRYGEYVALGDSFTAGPLIPKLVPALGCFRSSHNYPALLARRLGVDSLVDVSCSGASTRHLAGRQNTGFARVPPQLAALSADTDLVTVGMGGNDGSVFGRLVTSCPQLRSLDPDGSPCRRSLEAGAGTGLLEVVDRTEHRLDRALRRVRARAPRARVLVVGYPRVAPRQGTCPDVLPFARGDYRYADEVTRRLDRALRRAARANDMSYVDTYAASRGHDACAGESAWLNGQAANALRAQAYHPLRVYMRAVASLVAARLG